MEEKSAKNNRSNAVLEIDGFEPRKVCDFNFEFNQPYDNDNQPAGIPRGGALYVKVDAFSQEENMQLLHWMLSHDMKKNGKITVYKPSNPDVVLKTIEFEEAYCVYYKEVWKDLKTSAIESTNIEEIKIIWNHFKVGPVKYDYDWNKDY